MVKTTTVRDGPTGRLVDISEVTGITSTKEFNRLRSVRQLGCAWTVFNGARHTRAGHGFGTYDKTREYEEVLGLDPEVALVGLIHDISHTAYSHDGETALKFYDEKNHDERLDHLFEIEDEIEESFDFTKVKRIFERRDPQWRVIWTRMGTDKQDYVNRDLYYCGFDPVETAGFAKYASYDKKDGLCFDVSQAKWAKDFMNAWWGGHQEIYFRKKVLLVQEEMIRAIYHALETGELERRVLLDGVDSQVEAALLGARKRGSSQLSPSEMMKSVLGGRGTYKTVLTLKNEGRGMMESRKKKALAVAELPREGMKRFEERIRGRRVIGEEEKLSKELGYSVLVCRMANADRFEPEDAVLKNGSEKTTLFTQYPAFKKSLEEATDAFYALRIAVPAEKRGRVFRNDVETIMESLEIEPSKVYR